MLVSTTNRIYQNEQVLELDQDVSVVFQTTIDHKVEKNLAKLSLENSWGDRQAAARRLGSLQDPAAVSGLTASLQRDNFWKVRCAIIQALEMISDPRSIPVLHQVSQNDDFQIVRSYANKAVERLSRY